MKPLSFVSCFVVASIMSLFLFRAPALGKDLITFRENTTFEEVGGWGSVFKDRVTRDVDGWGCISTLAEEDNTGLSSDVKYEEGDRWILSAFDGLILI